MERANSVESPIFGESLIMADKSGIISSRAAALLAPENSVRRLTIAGRTQEACRRKNAGYDE